MRPFLLLALRLLERGLDYTEAARTRVELRQFLRDHPDVIVHPWTDGTN